MERHVYHHETIEGSLDDVLELVAAQVANILGPHIDDDDHPVHRLHAHFAGSDVSKRVQITAEDLEEFTEGTHRLRVTWHATDNKELYPVMIGELEFTGLSVNPPRCEVAFIGHYKPPLGFAGAIADRIVGHRIASEAVSGFVTDVCERLERTLRERHPAGAASA